MVYSLCIYQSFKLRYRGGLGNIPFYRMYKYAYLGDLEILHIRDITNKYLHSDVYFLRFYYYL